MPENEMIKYGVDIPNADKCPKCGKDLINRICPDCGSEPLEKEDEKKDEKKNDNKKDYAKMSKTDNYFIVKLEKKIKKIYKNMCKTIISAAQYVIEHQTLNKYVVLSFLDNLAEKMKRLEELYKQYYNSDFAEKAIAGSVIKDRIQIFCQLLNDIINICFKSDLIYKEAVDTLVPLLRGIQNNCDNILDEIGFMLDDYEVEFIDTIRFAALTAEEHLLDAAGVDIDSLFEDIRDIMKDYILLDERTNQKANNTIHISTSEPKQEYKPVYCKGYVSIANKYYSANYSSDFKPRFEPFLIIKDGKTTVVDYGCKLTNVIYQASTLQQEK
jgi:ribosomal protein L32